MRFKQPKLERIYRKLYQAKGKGELENDLLDNLEKSGYARKIMSTMNKKLGADSIYKEDGKWKLDKSLWDFEPADFRNLILVNEISRMRSIMYISILTAFVSITLLAVLLTLTIEFN